MQLLAFILCLQSCATEAAVQPYAVVPVLFIADDKRDPADVSHAADNFESVVRYVRDWYSDQTGEEFPLWSLHIVHSPLTAAQWAALSDGSHTSSNPYLYLQEVQKEMKSLVPQSDHLRYVVGVFAGFAPQLMWGAADYGSFAAVPPRSAAITCPVFTNNNQRLSPECANSVYAMAHELGHAFGLVHSCDIAGFPDDPHCNQSVMASQLPPDMILLEGEKRLLLSTPYFLGAPIVQYSK